MILNTKAIIKIHKLHNIIFTLIIIVLVAACDRNTSILRQMDMAEDLMDTKPDSAIVILENIPIININNPLAELN